MLKIYNAQANHGEIKLDDFIRFDHGRFDTGLNGFGQVSAGAKCTRANYDLESIQDFLDYSKSVKVEDGWIDKFVLWNPISYEELVEQYNIVPRTLEDYERAGLNEEGILLFTNYVNIGSNDGKQLERIFGRDMHTGLYLLRPNDSISMSIDTYNRKENYEVLQSQKPGKKLILAKMKRII